MKNTEKIINNKILSWLKPGSSKPSRPLAISAYRKIFKTEEGEIVLEDLANIIFNRVIDDKTSDSALRLWAGEIKLFKYILNKIYKEQKYD